MDEYKEMNFFYVTLIFITLALLVAYLLKPKQPYGTISHAGYGLRVNNADCTKDDQCLSAYCKQDGKSGKCSSRLCLMDHYQWIPGQFCCSGKAYTNQINLVLCGSL